MEKLKSNKEYLIEVYNKIYKYLWNDIMRLKTAEKEGVCIGCGTYILVVCSGIEFFGSLIVPDNKVPKKNKKGLEGKSKSGFEYFIKTYMSEIDKIYNHEKITEFIYKFIRCGQTHESIAKMNVIIGKNTERKFHLRHISNLNVIYFSVYLFVEDFLSSLEKYKIIFNDGVKIKEMVKRLKENESIIQNRFENYLGIFETVNATDEEINAILELGSSYHNYKYESDQFPA